jgi:bacterioferritin-associated ferredoxin
MESNCPKYDCNDCPGRVVCRCLGVTEEALLAALAHGDIRSLREVRQRTGAGDGCTCCHGLLRHYLELYSPSASSALPICSVK